MTLYDNSMYLDDVNMVAMLDLPWDKLQGKSVLISGATGLVGSFLVDVMMKKNEEEIGIGETAAVIGDIAAILGLSELKSVAGLVGDVKAVKESMDKEAGAYEGRQGVSAAKDIIDTVTNLK